MSAKPEFLGKNAQVDKAALKPFPNSQKIYVEGSQSDIRVPMREISCNDTPLGDSSEKNPPVTVYDTSGPYTDPNATIDIQSGLPGIRADWIAKRADTLELDIHSSSYTSQRINDSHLNNIKFSIKRKPRRAVESHNVTQLHLNKV
jgi:phosphomethylpyrimidine synthase